MFVRFALSAFVWWQDFSDSVIFPLGQKAYPSSKSHAETLRRVSGDWNWQLKSGEAAEAGVIDTKQIKA